MTKEEIEADRIIKMFRFLTDLDDYNLSWYVTKKAALLHVNGLIETLDDMYNGYYTMPSEVSDKVDSLEKVKEIIESK